MPATPLITQAHIRYALAVGGVKFKVRLRSITSTTPHTEVFVHRDLLHNLERRVGLFGFWIYPADRFELKQDLIDLELP